MLTVNITNIVVISIISGLCLLVIIYLIKAYSKNSCGVCSQAKKCQAYNKKNILKAYKKACKEKE